MRTIMRRLAVLAGVFVVVVGCTSSAFAWGDRGHRIVGAIARELLNDSSRVEITEIMGSDNLPVFALYMDKNKAELDAQIPGSRDWHYDDIPVCGKDVSYRDYCPRGNCASTQLYRHYKLATDSHSTPREREFSIYVLSHVIGDIHQPLHAADNEDVGGNQVRVRLPDALNKRVKLHAFWDTEVIERLYPNQSETAIAKALVERYKSKRLDWEKGNFSAWIKESHKLAYDYVYGKLPGFACGRDMESSTISLTDEYMKMAMTLVDEQLAKGGFRLALILNRAFDD